VSQLLNKINKKYNKNLKTTVSKIERKHHINNTSNMGLGQKPPGQKPPGHKSL
jgi:hypothetical protein